MLRKQDSIRDETFENFEGCLSVPNLRGVVRRHAQLRVRALDRHGDLVFADPVGSDALGVAARSAAFVAVIGAAALIPAAPRPTQAAPHPA